MGEIFGFSPSYGKIIFVLLDQEMEFKRNGQVSSLIFNLYYKISWDQMEISTWVKRRVDEYKVEKPLKEGRKESKIIE